MVSFPNINVSDKDETTLKGLRAYVKLQNETLEHYKQTNADLINEIKTLKKDFTDSLVETNKNINSLAEATKSGFDAVNERLTEEAKRSRAVTRLWSSFGFGVFTLVGKTLFDRFGEFWGKLFTLLT